ncbi:MAG: GGDEF domain-containing protein [Gammaproteobacteria bacterium]|nr:GGDEF domain-containing protein [Gammaproteobacteria bacterium]
MSPDWRHLTVASVPPVAIVATALALAHGSASLPAVAGLFPLVCHVVLVAGIMLSLIFRRGREFSNLLVILLAYEGLRLYVWQPGAVVERADLYAWIALLAPANVMLNEALLERGLLNRHGLRRAALLLLQLGLVAWLVSAPPVALTPWLYYAFYSFGFLGHTSLPQPALVMTLVCLASLVIFHFAFPSLLQGAALAATLSLILALHYASQPLLSSSFFLLAASAIGVALIAHSYILAYTDELTGLPSRRAMRQEFMSLGSQYSIALLDIDRFKKLNDSFGHDVGDQVLRLLSVHLRRVSGGKAYRYGGEEFAIVFPGKDRKFAVTEAEVLREQIGKAEFRLRGKDRPKEKPAPGTKRSPARGLDITVSIGVAERSERQHTPQDVLRAADRALYRAKAKGRNRVVV